jgi:hypothetical protein
VSVCDADHIPVVISVTPCEYGAMADARDAGARGNTFVLAAVALPIVVAGFFLLASAVPRWTVPPPTYDLLIRLEQPWSKPRTVAVDLAVREGKVVATARPVPAQSYEQRWALYLVDPDGGSMRAIPTNAPETMEAGAPPREWVVEGLAGLQVSADAVAPDGYRLQQSAAGGRGLVGGLFGMGRRQTRVALVNRGRVVSIDTPEQNVNPYAIGLVGWIVGKSGG